MIFQFGSYKIDVDVDRTRQFYETASFVSENCSCSGCRNYEKAVQGLPALITDFFADLGVDMRRVCEVYVNYANPDGSLFYGGFYHLCGTLLSGKSAWLPTTPTSSYWEADMTFPVTENFRVSFQEECHLLETDFPLPALQLELSANIPWVLAEENTWK
jgi:hypothetical protein